MKKTIFKTDICANCGGHYQIHHYKEPYQCPKNGRDNTPEQWQDTYFEDSGEKRLRDAAPLLYETLSEAITELEKFIPITEVSVLDKCNQALSLAK